MNIRIMPMSFLDFEFIGKDINYVQEHFFMKDLIEVNKGGVLLWKKWSGCK